MKITVLGGGPAGLYTSILLKKAHPNLDITLWERNPRGATFGWGVVFSDRTLNAFREADNKSYIEITSQFVLWEAIDTYYRGERIRCSGHAFAGMGRRELLIVLQERCRELGVKLNFEVEIESLEQFADSDLIIAADGINSLTRRTYAEAFQPSLDVRKAKFAWYGTHKVFDSFSFIFQETEYGLFQAHCYPFNGTTSTFIIECSEETWQRAGLDTMSEEESLRYCEQVFAPYLSGQGLMANRSLWINFATVKNRRWSHQNIVLMGDAVHTAHFSIGSGTKLAMEDAIAFANAFELHGADLPAVFKNYEAERRPATERLQAAAQESLTYFENVERYTHLDPLQFTFHMLTRSGRISYNNLSQRDPQFTETVTRWFADHTTGPKSDKTPSTKLIAPPPMFTPLALREMTLANRVVLTSPPTGLAQAGLPAETHHHQIVAQAQSGVGLVLSEPVAVSAEGRITAGDVGLYTPEQAQAWADIVTAVHTKSEAKIALQLNHAGRRGATRPRQAGVDRPLQTGAWPLLAPSALPYSPQSQTPQAMKQADMKVVRDRFKQATQLAQEAGFDMLHLHLAHGYLLGSFISPLSNQRTDKYGGSLENRLRFPLEIFDTVRKAWPKEKPLSVAISANDWASDGADIEEAIEVAKMLQTHGCDLVEILAGQTILNSKPDYKPYFLASYSEMIRNDVGIKTMVGGGLTITDQVNSLLAGGRADLCIMNPG